MDSAFDRYLVKRSSPRRFDRSAHQEGLISALWQSWCSFCRTVIIESAIGTTDGKGNQIVSQYAGRTEPEIAYIAKVLAEGGTVRKIKAVKGSHQEPTWGDLNKISRIATGIGPTNESQLLTAFGIGSTLRDLQLCRNACAHINADLINEIGKAKVRYSDTRVLHPSDFIFWIDPNTKNFVWKSWIDEMELISDAATG